MMRDELPTTHGEVLRHWLGYRYPHYDDGSAGGRHADGRAHRCRPRRVGRRNPDPSRMARDTLHADGRDAGPCSHSNRSGDDEASRNAAPPRSQRRASSRRHDTGQPANRPDHGCAAQGTRGRALRSYCRLRSAHALQEPPVRVGVRRGHGCRRSQGDRASHHQRATRNWVQGFLLIPPMVVKPAMLADWLSYQALLDLRARLDPRRAGTWRPEGVAVCRGCTTVFVPRRRRTAEFCGSLERPATREVLGQRSLMPGETRAVRAPELTGNLIVGWKSVTVGMCPECGEPFIGRRDSTTCQSCAPRVRQRRRRGAGATRLRPLPE